jgi:C-terminal processing protease CtpA/Prc
MAYEMDKAGRLRIKEIFPNTSASHAGLTSGLVIQKINGIPTRGKTLTECVGLGNERADGKVAMELVDLAQRTTNTVELIRKRFLVPG